jgi:hypothetical protein
MGKDNRILFPAKPFYLCFHAGKDKHNPAG